MRLRLGSDTTQQAPCFIALCTNCDLWLAIVMKMWNKSQAMMKVIMMMQKNEYKLMMVLYKVWDCSRKWTCHL